MSAFSRSIRCGTGFRLRNARVLIVQEESVSYEQLDATTTSLAQALLAQGCQPGDRIALHWPNSIEMAKLLFACFKAGLIAVPINLFLKAPEIGHILANSGAAMCFTPLGRVSVVREAAQDTWALAKLCCHSQGSGLY